MKRLLMKSQLMKHLLRPLHEQEFYFLARRKRTERRSLWIINDRLSTFLTQPEDKRTIVQRSLLNKKTIFKLMVAGKIIITLGVLSAGVINNNTPDNFGEVLQKWKQPVSTQNASESTSQN